jgi:hypothetical protein
MYDADFIGDRDIWTGPHAERSVYGELTGERYHKCNDCGIEVHEDNPREHVEHRDGCRHSSSNDRPSARRRTAGRCYPL